MEIRILGPGGNWIRIGSMLALGLDGYHSKLPKGSTVSVTTGAPGDMCMDAPGLVANGVYDVAITTPAWYARAWQDGIVPGRFAQGSPLAALAVFPHNDRLALAVRAELPLRSIADIKAQKYPLRVSTPAQYQRHPAGILSDMVLNRYGFSLDDIVSWGGRVLADRPRFQNQLGEAPVAPEFEAVFDEAIMTLRWKQITDTYDLRFLPIDEDVLASFAQQGITRGVIPGGMFRGVPEDVPTLDFSGWLLFCRADWPADLAYLTMAALDEQTATINAMFGRSSGLTSPISLDAIQGDASLPVHAGAERYYREHASTTGSR